METVNNNVKGLKQLCDVIEQLDVRDSVLQLLQKWTGGVTFLHMPLSVSFSGRALKKHVEDIDSVQRQHGLKWTIQATNITQQIIFTP